jgi:hypothetical protein
MTVSVAEYFLEEVSNITVLMFVRLSSKVKKVMAKICLDHPLGILKMSMILSPLTL